MTARVFTWQRFMTCTSFHECVVFLKRERQFCRKAVVRVCTNEFRLEICSDSGMDWCGCLFSLSGDDRVSRRLCEEQAGGPKNDQFRLRKTGNRQRNLRRSAVFLKREAHPWRGAFRLGICRSAGMTESRIGVDVCFP